MLKLNDLPILIADEDFIQGLRDQEFVSIELDELIVEYAEWERENVTFFSRLVGKIRAALS